MCNVQPVLLERTVVAVIEAAGQDRIDIRRALKMPQEGFRVEYDRFSMIRRRRVRLDQCIETKLIFDESHKVHLWLYAVHKTLSVAGRVEFSC